MDTLRISEYLHSLETDRGCLLEDMRDYAVKNDVPIVRRETESLLRALCAVKNPESVLEIGTAIAYSTIVFAGYAGKVTTIENYEKRIVTAKENIRRSGHRNIELLEGDATEILKKLRGNKYDIIFLDAAKGQYLNWLPDIMELMDRGSILISDNVLQDGDVMESRYTVDRRERTTHSRMREFLYEIKHDERLETAVTPTGDGVSISVRI